MLIVNDEHRLDIYTFFSPPAPYKRLFVLSSPEAASHP
jgi:hypothetical protein